MHLHLPTNICVYVCSPVQKTHKKHFECGKKWHMHWIFENRQLLGRAFEVNVPWNVQV